MDVKTFLFVLFNNNTTGDISGAGTVNPSGAHEFIPVFSGILVDRLIVVCGCSCCPRVLLSCGIMRCFTVVINMLHRGTHMSVLFYLVKV